MSIESYYSSGLNIFQFRAAGADAAARPSLPRARGPGRRSQTLATGPRWKRDWIVLVSLYFVIKGVCLNVLSFQGFSCSLKIVIIPHLRVHFSLMTTPSCRRRFIYSRWHQQQRESKLLGDRGRAGRRAAAQPAPRPSPQPRSPRRTGRPGEVN